MTIIYALIFGSMMIFGGTAVYAFFWAANHGQMSDFDHSSRSIFDGEEPEGKMTDWFPGEKPQWAQGGALPATDAPKEARTS